jgi:hypothetical protein
MLGHVISLDCYEIKSTPQVCSDKQIRSTSQNPSEFSMVLGFPMVFHGFHAVFMVFSMNFSMVFSYLVGHGL